MNLPAELLTCIASEFDSIDLSNFRLVNRKCAEAATSLIPRHGISAMNITREMKELQYILQCPGIANNVNSLRVFHVEWPICSRYEWETHNLLFGGNGRMRNNLQFPTSPSAQRLCSQAFAAYRQLIEEQQCRRYSEEIESLHQIFIMLPNLRTIEVSDMHDYLWQPKANRRYHKLQRSIWISPFHSNNVTRTVEATLIASGSGEIDVGQVNSLHISGSFDPQDLYTKHSRDLYPHIQHLKIHDFRLCGNGVSIRKFLHGFPRLRTLSVSFQGGGPSHDVFKSLHWRELKTLDIRGMWTSDAEFSSILERHASLQLFSLHSPALTEGSWQTLFTKIRVLDTRAKIVLSGDLFGRTRGETMNMGCDKIRSALEAFLRDRELIWPFS